MRLRRSPGLRNNQSYKIFLTFELSITIGSFIAAWFLANALYPQFTNLFTWIGSLAPQPLTATGFQTAYVAAAGIVWAVSNTILFATGIRRI